MALPGDYDSLAASDKRALLWSRVSGEPYAAGPLPTSVPGLLDRLSLFSVSFNRGSFELPGDELPLDRKKLVHTRGTCALVELEVTHPTPFTGFFARGGHGLARFSDSKGAKCVTPSLAIKFFIDGGPSKNLLANATTARDPSDNRPLSSVLSNAIEPAKALDTKLVQRAFEKTSRALGGERLHAVYLPLHHLAEHTEDGRAAPSPVVPDRVEFVATEEARRLSDAKGDFREALAAIPAGTRLFDVKISPKIDAPATPLGALWLRSAWVASAYGDERLFFAHDVGPRGANAH